MTRHSAVRSLFLRGLGVVYLIAFLSLAWQVDGLYGSDGLRPVRALLARATDAGVGFASFPTLFWIHAGDATLRAACWAGVAGALGLIAGYLPLLGLVVSWVLYLSFVTAGAPFLSYQWDALLLETGFLAIFWAPITGRLSSPRATRPSPVVLWLLRWLVFRLMFFSGWVKLASGDPTWWDLTALEYHYETQPLPAWTSWYMHHLPAWFQKVSTAGTFGIELVLPFLILLGRRARAVAAAGFVGLQVFIGATGNYGFFNLLSTLLCVPLLDDAQLLALVPERSRARFERTPRPPSLGRRLLDPVLAVTIVALTLPGALRQLAGTDLGLAAVAAPVERLAQPFRLTSRYGLFAVMTTSRPEVIVEGSADGATWQPYVFRWKPGPVDRRPSFVEPHMPRLDWQMWFDALSIERALRSGGRAYDVVTPSLLTRLREGSPAVLGLLGEDPFDGKPPRYVRWRLFDYRFTSPAERAESGRWWKREPLWDDEGP